MILVTGAAGHVGGAALRRLLQGGRSVAAMVRNAGRVLVRTVHPVVPPKVEHRLTGLELGAALCGVRAGAAENLEQVERARQSFDEKAAAA